MIYDILLYYYFVITDCCMDINYVKYFQIVVYLWYIHVMNGKGMILSVICKLSHLKCTRQFSLSIINNSSHN